MPFSLLARIVAVLAIVTFIAGGLWKIRADGVKAGRAEVQSAWDADKAQRMAAALAASEAARAREQALMAEKARIEGIYAIAKKNAASAAAGAADELGRLRDELAKAAAGATRGGASSPSGGTHGAGTGELLGACAGDYQAVAREADRIAGKLTALQAFVAGSCR